jgi:hypothetical protein
MPVTAKLSKQFYDRFGEAVTNELVDWFNQVDAAYKSDIRDMNELNFARFDAKLEQRIGEVNAKIDVTAAHFDRRLAELRGEFRSDLQRGLHEHTRFFFLAWAVLLASNIALWFRG